MAKKITVKTLQKMKDEGEKITSLTAYDASTARYLDEAGIDFILVGDSVAMVVLGYDTTCAIGMDEMKIFTKAVARGAKRTLIVADMPFMSYHADLVEGVKNAGDLIKSGAGAVKIEGGSDYIVELVKRCTEAGIPVMAHLGFTPQFLNTLGGYKIQGKSYEDTMKILDQAKKLQDAGAFALVLEMVPEECATYITENLTIPTIGIGAGRNTSGQILVCDDIFGKYGEFAPKFARKYADMAKLIKDSASAYIKDVKESNFPNESELFKLSEDEVKQLYPCVK